MRVVGWRAWFRGRRIFTSERRDWFDLPRDGALGFVLFFDTKTPAGRHERRYMSGSDCYFRAEDREGEIFGQNDDSIEENETRYPGAVCIRGAWTNENEMHDVHQSMIEATTWQES